MPQPWMIFQACNPKNPKQPEHQFYFWAGKWPTPVHGTPTKPEEAVNIFWTGLKVEGMSEQEVEILNEAAPNKRKKKFFIPRRKQEFVVTARGLFPEE